MSTTLGLGAALSFAWGTCAARAVDAPAPKPAGPPLAGAVAIASEEPLLLRGHVDGRPVAPVVCPHDDSLYAVEVVNADGHHVWIVDERTDRAWEAMPPPEATSLAGDLEAPPIEYYSGRFRWSPKPTDPGRYAFAFVSTLEEESAELYVGSTGSKDVVRITENAAMAGPPEWSPDGDGLYFVQGGSHPTVCGVSGVSAIVSSTTGGGAATPVVRSLGTPPPGDGLLALSADGRWLCFAGREDESTGADLWVVATAGGTNDSKAFRLTRLSGDETRPSWSPDGRWIAFYHAPTRRGAGVELICAEIDAPSPEGAPGWVSAPTRAHGPRVSTYLLVAKDIEADVGTAPAWARLPDVQTSGDPEGRGSPAVVFCSRADADLTQKLEVISPGRVERGLPGRQAFRTALTVVTGLSFGATERLLLCGQQGDDYRAIRAPIRPIWEAVAARRSTSEETIR